MTKVLSTSNHVFRRFSTHNTQDVEEAKFNHQDKPADVHTDDTQHYLDPHGTEDHKIFYTTYRHQPMAQFIPLINRTTPQHQWMKKATNSLVTQMNLTIRPLRMKPSTPTPHTSLATQSSPTSNKPTHLMSHHHLHHQQLSCTQNQFQHHTKVMLCINPQLIYNHNPQTINWLSWRKQHFNQRWSPLTNLLQSAHVKVLSELHHHNQATKHAMNCAKTLLKKPIKTTWCCSWAKNRISGNTFSVISISEERRANWKLNSTFVDFDVAISWIAPLQWASVPTAVTEKSPQ